MTDVTLQDIAGILGDTQWDTSGTNNLTFSFPTAASNYGDFYGAEDGFGGNGEPYSGFQPLTLEQQDVVRHDLNLVSQYTLLTFTEVTQTDDSGAVLRFAESAVPGTATFYSPSQFFGGDVWFGNTYFDDLTKASYGYSTTLQLIGDVLGLKAGPDPYPYGVLPPEHNSLEWSVMSFSSYIGADPSFYLANDGSGNQTYMINDIAALQYMYGANFNTNAGNTVYSWSPSTGETFIDGVGQGASTTNTVFAAIWDGGGVDTYDLSNYSTNLFIDLYPGEWSTFSTAQLADLDVDAPGVHLAAGNIANAYLYNDDPRSLIENAIGGSGDDEILGNQANNMLAGGAGNDFIAGVDGNDTLAGGAGNDTLFGGLGNDIMDGGAGGSDTADYVEAGSGVVVNLAHPGAVQNTVGAGIDTLSNIENLSGSDFNDTLTGDANANVLDGWAGNDSLVGAAGNDTMTADVGNDTVDGGLGNDVMDGGAAGSDTASYADAASAVTVSLAHQGSAQNTIGAGSDTLTNFENLTGSGFNDTLTGDARPNILNGGAGNDTIAGAVGNDTLTGLAGNDTLMGGAGNDSMDGGAAGSDTASYADATAGVTVSLAIATAQNTIGAGVDTLVNFENLTGSNFNDTLTGNSVANILNGGAGNDTLNAGVGNDSLIGGIGNDTLIGGAGNDSMDGGAAGSDTASYADATAGVTVSLAIATAQNTIGAGVDTLVNFGNLTGSNFNDTLTGNGVANILNGGAGNDMLNAGVGNDSLIGGIGNDTLIGGAGNDSLDGGAAGSDTASYADATAGVTVSLAIAAAQNTIGAGVDTLVNFENLTGSNFNDKLTGNAAANTLYGLGGNDTLNGAAGIDTLSGAAGNDRLIGGAGNDSLDGGVGNDSFVFDKGFGKDTITGFVATGAAHDKIDFSTAVFGSFAAIKSHMVQSGGNVVITLDSADTITLKSVTLASLTAADFTFHPGTAPAAPAYLAAPPSASPDSSHVNVASMASTASDHTWLDHSVHANALTMFG